MPGRCVPATTVIVSERFLAVLFWGYFRWYASNTHFCPRNFQIGWGFFSSFQIYQQLWGTWFRTCFQYNLKGTFTVLNLGKVWSGASTVVPSGNLRGVGGAPFEARGKVEGDQVAPLLVSALMRWLDTWDMFKKHPEADVCWRAFAWIVSPHPKE